MKQIFDGKPINRITVETRNNNIGRGKYFARKLIEFETGERVYTADTVAAGSNITFLAGGNLLVDSIFELQNTESKEIAVTATVLSGTLIGGALIGTLKVSDGRITIRLNLTDGKTAGSARLFIGGTAVAEISGIPQIAGKTEIVITLEESVQWL